MLKDFLVRTMDDLQLRPMIEIIIGTVNAKMYLHLKYKRKIFFMLMPTYGNLGDQAIAVGTLYYLSKYFPEYEIIQIDLKQTYKSFSAIKRVISNDDIIVLQGGGNMGNLYLYIEKYRRAILRVFKNHKIISMPVTATFTDDKPGTRQLKKSQKIYRKCKNLTIIARENFSYDYLKKHFRNNKILLSPDMAFFLAESDLTKNSHKRSGIMLCLRHDLEMTGNYTDSLIYELFDHFNNCRIYDTTVTRDIPKESRKYEVLSALKEFSSSEVVITNRLHAMIMSALTCTPCIVTNALDWKINGTYNWIKEIHNIRFVDQLNMDKIVEFLSEQENQTLKRLDILPYFKELTEKLDI